VYTDPKPHLLTGRSIGVLLSCGLLHLDSTLHGIHGTGEIGKNAVARRIEDPTAMSGDQAIDDGPVRGKGAKRADLIEHPSTSAAKIAESFRSTLWASKVRSSQAEYTPTGQEFRGPVNHSEAEGEPISTETEDFPFSTTSASTGSPKRFFETFRCKPFGLAEPKRWISRAKGCVLSAAHSSVRPGWRPESERE
jgi:hypothetical protein